MLTHFFTYRWTLETIGSLEPRKSALEDDFEEEEKEDEDQLMAALEDDADEKVRVNALQEKNKKEKRKKKYNFFPDCKAFLMLNYSCYNRIIIVNVALHEKEIETENVIVTDTGMVFFYFQFSVFFLMT